MFGVPGDFNLGFLVSDIMMQVRMSSCIYYDFRTLSKTTLRLNGLEIGALLAPFRVDILTFHSNELNAAYAADGYARVKEHSIGAVTTTCACVIPQLLKFDSSPINVALVSASSLLLMELPEVLCAHTIFFLI